MRLVHRRYIFLSLLALFIVPLWVAVYLYAHPTLLHLKQLNHGVLLNPPVSEAVWKTQLKLPIGQWWVVYVEPKSCQAMCQTTLHQLRQIHVALGKQQSHIRRGLLIVAPLEKVVSQHIETMAPGTVVVSVRGQLLRILSPEHPEMSAIYVVDPAGRFILRYTPTDPQRFIYEDLNRLLRVNAK